MADHTPKLASTRPSVRTVTGWTILLMVLLRIAIGWHLLYEGVDKLRQGDWTATNYLLASSGPYREHFRGLVPDPDGLQRMTAESVSARIDERLDVLARHYSLSETQKSEAREDPASDDGVKPLRDLRVGVGVRKGKRSSMLKGDLWKGPVR